MNIDTKILNKIQAIQIQQYIKRYVNCISILNSFKEQIEIFIAKTLTQKEAANLLMDK